MIALTNSPRIISSKLSYPIHSWQRLRFYLRIFLKIHKMGRHILDNNLKSSKKLQHLNRQLCCSSLHLNRISRDICKVTCSMCSKISLQNSEQEHIQNTHWILSKESIEKRIHIFSYSLSINQPLSLSYSPPNTSLSHLKLTNTIPTNILI